MNQKQPIRVALIGSRKLAEPGYAPLKHLHIIPTNPELIKRSEEMVWATHPAPHRLSQGAMKLHSRNMNQVFGLDLNTPIDLCICWTKGGEAVGGTATAIKLCHNEGIPVFNLGSPYLDNVLEELDEFIDSLNLD